jgi:predicted alpha/beta hydrolase family esterase
LQAGFEDWYGNFEYGIDSFSGEVDRLYVVGYSIGSALALTYLDNNRDSDEIEALILLSPGLESTNEQAYLAPYLRHLYKWVVRQEDTDAVKYVSLPTNAAAEFFALSQSVTYDGFMPLEVRALMVASEDDTTVNVQTSLEFFCQNLNYNDNRLILYRSSHNGVPPSHLCDRIDIQENAMNDSRYGSHSHVAITIPPGDQHYGVDGNNPVCLAHVEFPERFQNCLSNDNDSVYAENNYVDENGLFEGKIVRRTSFNSHYVEMIAQIECFIRETCQTEN